MMNIPILYEDNHVLAVQKPVNVPVQGDASADVHMLDLLKHDLKVRYNKPGNVYLGLVHRLDRPVGGAMVFAKTSKGASRLSDLARKQELDRTYFAIVHNHLPESSGTLVNYLYKNKRENKVYITSKKKKEAKQAILKYEVLATTDAYSLVRVQLQTGRPHQIRVQLSGVGCPIYGDQKYGQHITKKKAQIALWSYYLGFKHPTQDKRITVISEPPNEYPWTLFSQTIEAHKEI